MLMQWHKFMTTTECIKKTIATGLEILNNQTSCRGQYEARGLAPTSAKSDLGLDEHYSTGWLGAHTRYMISLFESRYLTVYVCYDYQGAVIIAPSGMVPVCNGDQLELTCTLIDSGSFSLLLWNVTLISDDAITPPVSFIRTISSSSPSDQTFQIVVNSTSLIFSRISAHNSIPFVSRLLINPVSSNLNGAEVKCLEVLTSESSSTTVINTSDHPIQGMIAIGLWVLELPHPAAVHNRPYVA